MMLAYIVSRHENSAFCKLTNWIMNETSSVGKDVEGAPTIYTHFLCMVARVQGSRAKKDEVKMAKFNHKLYSRVSTISFPKIKQPRSVPRILSSNPIS